MGQPHHAGPLSLVVPSRVFSEGDKAVLFYAQSWAFLRYLRTGAGKEVGEKLRLWEVQCRGAAMGEVRGARGRQGPAVNLFDSLFGDEIEDLETGFKAWLRLQ